jgi:hypothetical protein
MAVFLSGARNEATTAVLFSRAERGNMPRHRRARVRCCEWPTRTMRLIQSLRGVFSITAAACRTRTSVTRAGLMNCFSISAAGIMPARKKTNRAPAKRNAGWVRVLESRMNSRMMTAMTKVAMGTSRRTLFVPQWRHFCNPAFC